MTTTSTPQPEPFGSIPAASVIAACLSAQADVTPRSALARIVGRSPLSDESRPWYVGALGEIRVAKQLARLGSGWTVLHSVPIGDRGSDIDHVVVGPAGVFTINTKFHEDARVWVGSKRLLVNGQKTDHLRNSRFEATRVAQMLTRVTGTQIDVHPVLVLVGVRSITVRQRPEDVAVLRETELVRWLNRRPVTIDAEGQSRLSAAVARRDAWTAASAQPVDGQADAFAALRREVQAARRTRVLWGIALMVGTLATAGALAVNAASSFLGG